MRQHAGWLVAAASICALLAGSALSGPTTPAAVNGCVYNATPPTLSDLQTGVFQCDANAQLKVAATATLTNPTIGAAVPATANYVAGNKGGLLVGITLDASSYLNVNCQTGCSGGTFNNNADNVATSSTNGQSAAWLYGWDGAAWDRVPATSADGMLVNLGTNNDVTVTGTVSGTGAAGTAATGVLTVQGIASMTPVQVSQATATNLKAEIVGPVTPGDGSGLGSTSIRAFTTSGIYNGTNIDLWREIVTGTNSTGTGIAAVGQVGQCDDTSPQLITENQFGNILLDCTNHTTVIGGLVTTAAPSYTTATSRGVSLTTAGGLRSDLATVAGTTTHTNSGNKSAGTQRVVLATDQPALTNKLLVTPDSVALPANQSTNISQINAVTPLMGNGTTGTGSLRVTLSSDNTSNTNPFLVNGNVTPADDATLGTTSIRQYALLGIYDGSTIDMLREVTNGLNSTGAGIPTAGQVGQCDDTSPQAITENSFGNARIDCATHAQLVTEVPSATADGLLQSSITAFANSENETEAKATAGKMYGAVVFNNTATIAYITFYNTAAAGTTCGTNEIMSWLIPASTSGAGFVVPIPAGGLTFSTAISYCITTGIGGTGSVAANSGSATVFYK